MATNPTASPAPEALALRRPGGFAVSLVARAYLSFLGALALIALLPLLVGLSGTIVQSESMQPLIRTGDVVLTYPYSPEDPVPMGGVVTFLGPTGSRSSGLILHRLVAQGPDGTFVTAGDGNADADSSPLTREGILGVGVIRVPWVGLPAFWATRGEVLPLLLWTTLTLAALGVEAIGVWGRTARHRVPAPPPSGARILRRPAAVVLTLTVVASVAALPLGPAEAAFTARTTAIGSTWSAATASPVTRIEFHTQPSSTATGGTAWERQPSIEFLDASGKRVKGTRTVDLTLVDPGEAVLSCSANPLTATNGLAHFGGCSITRAGTYTLRARSAGLTAVSTSVVVAVGPAAGLVFTISPSNATATQPFPTQPVVAIVDAGGNRTTSTAPVTLAITSPAGATLGCTVNPRFASAGMAAFAGCAISKEGTYTLTATSGTLTSATSAIFAATADRPALVCQSTTWMATFSWSPTPFVPTTYRLYVDGIQVPATGADGWNSYVQLTSANVPAATFPQGSATVEVRKVVAGGGEQVIGFGTVMLGSAGYRTYLCG
jgi:signal peptidase I